MLSVPRLGAMCLLAATVSTLVACADGDAGRGSSAPLAVTSSSGTSVSGSVVPSGAVVVSRPTGGGPIETHRTDSFTYAGHAFEVRLDTRLYVGRAVVVTAELHTASNRAEPDGPSLTWQEMAVLDPEDDTASLFEPCFATADDARAQSTRTKGVVYHQLAPTLGRGRGTSTGTALRVRVRIVDTDRPGHEPQRASNPAVVRTLSYPLR